MVNIPNEKASGSGSHPILIPPCWATARVITSGPSSSNVEKISVGRTKAFLRFWNGVIHFGLSFCVDVLECMLFSGWVSVGCMYMSSPGLFATTHIMHRTVCEWKRMERLRCRGQATNTPYRTATSRPKLACSDNWFPVIFCMVPLEDDLSLSLS